MKLNPPKRADALIPTASMADIAFLLIIFFMVTTVFEADRTSVNLPLAGTRTEAEKGAAIVVLGKQADAATGTETLIYKFSNGEDMSNLVSGPDDIYLEASRLTFARPDQQFILKADGSVHFEKIDELLDTMRRGGVQNVLLLSGQALEE